MLLSNLGHFMFQEGKNIMFYKELIHCYGKSYIFLTKINKSSDSARLFAGIIQRKPGIAQLNTMYDRYIFITHY